MSIISAFYQDQLITQIRNSVAARSEKIPYVLLPVRLETRFMEVPDLPEVDLPWSVSVVQQYAKFHDALLQATYRTDNASFNKTTAALKELSNKLAEKSVVSGAEKTILNQALQQLNSERSAIATQLKKSRSPVSPRPPVLTRRGISLRGVTSNRLSVNRILAPDQTKYSNLLKQIDQLAENLQAIKPEKKQPTDEYSIILNELNRLEKETGKWREGRAKIPYTDIKNKKSLYVYLSQTVNAVEELAARIAAYSLKDEVFTQNQWDRIDALYKSIALHTRKAPAAVRDLHKDKHWKEFVKNDFTAAATRSSKALTVKTRAFLLKGKKQIKERNHVIPALQAYVTGVTALVQMKRFNLQPAVKFADISRYHTQLKKTMTQLESLQSSVQKDTLLRSLMMPVLNESSTQLTASTTKTAGYSAANKSQKFGQKLASDYQAVQASKVIEDWKLEIDLGTGVFQKKKKQLWIRIYPDDIFVKTHESALSPVELEAGKSFWKYWWTASADRELELAAWKILCEVLGTRRASWIARSLDPRKLPANAAYLSKRPSTPSLSAIQLAELAVKDLNSIIIEGKLTDWLPTTHTMQHLNKALQDLQKMAAVMPAIKKDQVPLGDRMRVKIIQSASVLEQIFGKVNEEDPASLSNPILQPALSVLEKISLEFQAIQTAFNKVAWMDIKSFAAEQADYPSFPVVPEKTENWTTAPYTDSLPKRFVAIARRGNAYIHIKVGSTIPDNVQMGLDPATFADASLYEIDENGNLKMDPGIEWMANYPKAVSKGLAITMDITADDYEKGFDQLIVLGLSEETAAQDTATLADLVENHLYSPDGIELLKIGTPTNNTADKKSGYTSDADVEESFDIEINGKGLDTPSGSFDKTDGQQLAELLSLPVSLIGRINGANNREMAGSRAMNRVLWPATLGHQMEEMWDSFFTYDNIRRTEDFFVHWVSGRGQLPSLRIGSQPYGLLVSTAYSRFSNGWSTPSLSLAEAATIKPWGAGSIALENKLQQRFENRLWELLQFLAITWKDLRNKNVVHAGNMKVNGSDDEQRFMDMLGLNAHSMEYHFRYALNLSVGMEGSTPGFTTQFGTTDPYGPTSVFESIKEFAAAGIFRPSFDFSDENAQEAGTIPAYQITDSRYSRIRDQINSSRLYAARLGEDNLVLAENLVQSNTEPDQLLEPLSGSSMNYLNWLLAQSSSDILGGNDFEDPARIPDHSLLFFMLRQGLLQSYQRYALDLMQYEGLIKEVDRRVTGSRDKYLSLYFIDNDYKRFYTTKWHMLFKNLRDLVEDFKLPQTVTANPFYQYIDGSVTSMARYLDRVRSTNPSVFDNQHKTFFNKLRLNRDALQFLSRFSVEQLEHLLAEHVDLCSYRLDAWQTGFAAKRLTEQRRITANGMFLGAYGYVENLLPDKNKTISTQSLAEFKLPADKPVYQDPDNQGFIHAPSITHAVTAAVLRNAYTNNREEGDVENRLAINLSSSRVRMALRLMEGIRNGQETGAILGFQFERGLHERFQTVELDKYIQPFRKAYPLQQAVVEAAPGTEPPYVSIVPDGLAMLNDVYSAIDWVNPATNASKDKTVAQLLKENNYSKLPAKIKSTIDTELKPTDDKNKVYNNIIDEIDRMADAFDALGDVALSESVYQMVAGNHVRAAAVLDALADGRVIPEPDIIRTPRTGTVLTHRILLNLEKKTAGELPPQWTFANSVKAMTEPSLNYWLGSTLGNPAQIQFVLEKRSAPDDAPILDTMSLAELPLQPIDLYTMPGNLDEWVQSIVAFVREDEQDYASLLTINASKKPAGATASVLSLTEVYQLLQHIRNMLSNARTAGASDFQQASENTSFANAGNYSLPALESRIQGALSTMNLYISQLEAETYISQILDGTVAIEEIALTTLDLTDMIGNLKIALYLGFPNAMNLPLENGADLVDNARSCLRHLLSQLKEARKRVAAANAEIAALPPASNPRLLVEKWLEVGKTLLGKNFLILPAFTRNINPDISAQLALPLPQKLSRHGGPLAVENWLQQIARVRPRMSDLHQYRRLADAFNMPEVDMQPAQVPYVAADYWLGISYPSSFSKSGDITSLFLLNDSVLQQSEQCALLIDEWHEVIPGKEETTGISFHYNQPGATAPQAVLIATAPAADQKWTWDDIVYSIIDTVELAKNRAVEPDHIGSSWLNQILPGIFAEVVPPQIRDESDNPLGVQAVMDFANVKLEEPE